MINLKKSKVLTRVDSHECCISGSLHAERLTQCSGMAIDLNRGISLSPLTMTRRSSRGFVCLQKSSPNSGKEHRVEFRTESVGQLSAHILVISHLWQILWLISLLSNLPTMAVVASELFFKRVRIALEYFFKHVRITLELISTHVWIALELFSNHERIAMEIFFKQVRIASELFFKQVRITLELFFKQVRISFNAFKQERIKLSWL